MGTPIIETLKRKKSTRTTKKTRWMLDPPCRLAKIVKFNPKCPYSSCANCSQCMATDSDEFYIECLRDAHIFGSA